MKQKTIIVASLLLFVSCSTAINRLKGNSKGKSSNSQSKVKLVSGPTSKTSKYFIDVTDKAGLGGIEAVATYAVDFNNDGHTDLVFLPDFYSIPVFYQFNAKKSQYIKVSKSPLPRNVRASFMLFADFDKDGFLDVVVGSPKRVTSLDQTPLRFFKAMRSGFTSISYEPVANTGINKLFPTYGISVLDFDLDGNLDLFLANRFDKNGKRTTVSPDRLFRGNKFKFKDFSAVLEGEHKYNGELELYLNAKPSYGTSICDFNFDGYPDIMTVSSGGYANKLWINRPDPESGRSYFDYGKESKFAHDDSGNSKIQEGGNSFFSKCEDYNNDQIMDVALGELSFAYDPSYRDRSSILTGDIYTSHPNFLRSEYYMDDGSLNWGQGDRRGVFLDFNLDGVVDLAVDNSGFPPGSRFILFEQQQDHSFIDISKVAGVDILNPSGTVTLDYNRDGKVDLLLGQTNTRNNKIKRRVYLFQNNYNVGKNKSIKVELKGVFANSYGIGATVKLTTSTRTLTKINEYVYGGFGSQNEYGLLFGINTGDIVKKVEVIWPIANKKGKAKKVTYRVRNQSLKSKNLLVLFESGEAKLLPYP